MEIEFTAPDGSKAVRLIPAKCPASVVAQMLRRFADDVDELTKGKKGC